MGEQLRAYVSGALTGVASSQVRAVYEGAAEALRQAGFTPYLPHVATDPVLHPSVSAEKVYATDRRELATADLMIAFLTYPSFGVGAELEIAAQALVPVLICAGEGVAVSRMALGNPALKIGIVRFAGPSDLFASLQTLLPTIAEELRTRVPEELPPIGELVARARRGSGMSRAELGRRMSVNEQSIRLVEQEDPRVASPSLPWIVAAAAALNVEPSVLVGRSPREQPLLISLRSYAQRRGLADGEIARLERFAARGMRSDQTLTDGEWDQIRAQLAGGAYDIDQPEHLPGQ